MIRIFVAIIIVVLVGSSLAAVALVGLDEDLFFSWNRLLRSSFKDMTANGKRGRVLLTDGSPSQSAASHQGSIIAAGRNTPASLLCGSSPWSSDGGKSAS
jgi:hypothetical protein